MEINSIQNLYDSVQSYQAATMLFAIGLYISLNQEKSSKGENTEELGIWRQGLFLFWRSCQEFLCDPAQKDYLITQFSHFLTKDDRFDEKLRDIFLIASYLRIINFHLLEIQKHPPDKSEENKSLGRQQIKDAKFWLKMYQPVFYEALSSLVINETLSNEKLLAQSPVATQAAAD